MTQKELIADLRNKLSPMFNYIKVQRELEKLTSNNSEPGYYTITMIEKLRTIADEEQLKAEESMHQVSYILEKLESHEN